MFRSSLRELRSAHRWTPTRQRHPRALDKKLTRSFGKRGYTVIAIETSCDDTSVAVVKARHVHLRNLPSDVESSGNGGARSQQKSLALDVIFHEKVTANNDAYTGIHPLVALESHRANLAPLIRKAWRVFRQHDRERHTSDQQRHAEGNHSHPNKLERTPADRVPALDLIAVTRGPGMRSNLSVGLDTAKGLAAVWDIPLVGVHHMQAHALTPRLMTAISNHEAEGRDNVRELKPAFPFLSVLVSGGHTMLIDSAGLTEHTILAETQDIAIGDFLDKAARAILPPALLNPPYGRALERFAFHSKVRDTEDKTESLDASEAVEGHRHFEGAEYIQSCIPKYEYTAPVRRQDELERRSTEWGWALAPPLMERKGGESKRMVYSFAGLLTSVERLMKRDEPFSLRERQDVARDAQRVAFQHLASRVLLHISSPDTEWKGDTIVVSGGVASNRFLRHLLRSTLDARGFSHIKVSFPPIELCTDNALMIAWAGIEMYEARYSSGLDIGPIRKWSMDPKASDGGILGVGGWNNDK